MRAETLVAADEEGRRLTGARLRMKVDAVRRAAADEGTEAGEMGGPKTGTLVHDSSILRRPIDKHRFSIDQVAIHRPKLAAV